jgi:urea transport system permease protein
VIWVAVGGRGTLVGAVIGALAVNFLKTTFTTGMLAPFWLFVLGALFILVTVALPKGILGAVYDLTAKRGRGKPADAVPQAAE